MARFQGTDRATAEDRTSSIRRFKSMGHLPYRSPINVMANGRSSPLSRWNLISL